MTTTTRSHARVGETECWITMCYGRLVTDPDPEARVDYYRGEDRFRDEIETDTRPTLEEAMTFAERRLRAKLARGVELSHVEISEREWREEIHADTGDGWGEIQDAEAVQVRRHWVNLDGDGQLRVESQAGEDC